MRDYKGFTAEERLANLARVKQAIKDGILESPYKLKCEKCGQDKGVREYHCYDYTPEVALQSLQCLCWRCHRNLHTYERGEGQYYGYSKYYFREVAKGKVFPPVYTKYYTKEREEEEFGNG